jgi:predicted nucleic acid-binding protein
LAAVSFPQVPLAVLDANVWLSGLLPTDAQHVPAKAWLTNQINSGGYFIAPALFVVEVGASISRVTQDRAAAHRSVSQIYINPLIRLEALTMDMVDEAARIAVDLGLRAADAFYVEIAKRLQLPFATFNGEILARTAGVIQAIRP